jgi:hypothetical protein
MIDVALQWNSQVFAPFDDEDKGKCDEFKMNQVVRAKISGVKKERSYRQLKMFHGILRTVALNARHPNWNTIDKAKFSLKVALHYVDEGVTAVDKHGTVHFSYRSFGYDDLPHMEACNVFERSWPILAKVLGVKVEKLLQNADT